VNALYSSVIFSITQSGLLSFTSLAFRDVNIAFANELSMICDKVDINVWELIRLANRHPRVNILQPGPGVGGHCIAVDPWFIVSESPNESRLIKTAREVNDSKPDWVIEKITEEYKAFTQKDGSALGVVIYGIAFKENIDDCRESPALEIAKRTQDLFKCVYVHDENIKNENIIEYGLHPYEAQEARDQRMMHVFLVMHKGNKERIEDLMDKKCKVVLFKG